MTAVSDYEVVKGHTVHDAVTDLIAKYQRDGITAEELVDAAEDIDHPLHDRFTWDDTIAARNFRVIEARQILGEVLLIQPGGTEPIRAFVPVKVVDNPSEYRPAITVMGDPESRQQLFNRYRSMLKGYSARLGSFNEFKDIVDAIAVIPAFTEPTGD